MKWKWLIQRIHRASRAAPSMRLQVPKDASASNGSDPPAGFRRLARLAGMVEALVRRYGEWRGKQKAVNLSGFRPAAIPRCARFGEASGGLSLHRPQRHF